MTNNNIHPNETTRLIKNQPQTQKELDNKQDNFSLNSSNDFDEDEYDEDLLSQLDEEDLSNNINTIEMKLRKALKKNNPNRLFLKDPLFQSSSRRHLKWTREEDEKLADLVEKYKGRSWKKISQELNGRSSIQCLHRWSKILKPGLVKGPWTPEEDRMLINYVNYYGATDFSECSKIIQGRNNKQCRERWFNVLNPRVIKGEWSLEEDYLIFRLFKKFGGKWIKFIPFFNGLRAENSIKNRFYSTIRRFNTVLRKNNKEIESEEMKIDTIYNDFKSQLLEKYHINSDKDLLEFESSQLGFQGTLDETRKNNREIFINNMNKEKLGSNITTFPEADQEKSRFFLKSKDSPTGNNLDFPEKPSLSQSTEQNQPSSTVNNDTERSKDYFRSRKSSLITKVGVRKTNRDLDCQGQTSKTPFVKVKYPLKILNQSHQPHFQPSPTVKTQLTPLLSLNKLYSKEGCSEIGKTNQSLSLTDLEKDILSLCERPLFTFKDEQSRYIEDKLQKLTENYTYDPFKLSYDTTNMTELSSSLIHDSLSQSSFSGIVKQMNDLENLIVNTKSQILESYSNNLKQINAVQGKIMVDYSLFPVKNFEYETDSLVIPNSSNEMMFDFNFGEDFYGNNKI